MTVLALIGGFAVVGSVAGDPAAPPAAADPPDPVSDPPVLDPPVLFGPNDATLRVFVGSDRLANGTGESPLAGVTLALSNTQGGPLIAQPWATCESNSAGVCTFTVPIGPGGVAEYTSLWVRQTGSPAGYFANPSFGTGTTGATQTDYTFPTPRLRAGATYDSGSAYTGRTPGGDQPDAAFMTLTTEATSSIARSSGGVWQVSRTNPAPLAKCGVNIAVVIDLSASVNPSLPELKSAATQTVQALVGTPSSVALFTFGTNAPRQAGENMPLTPVSTQAGANTVIAKINGYPALTNQATNWDRGLAQVGNGFDIVIVLTDGNPTRSEPGAVGPGSTTRFKEIENGIFSANRIKAGTNSTGTVGQRIIAVGVGDALASANARRNLASISGPTPYPTTGFDYIATPDYGTAGQIMRALARAECPGSVSIIKRVVRPGGTIADAPTAGGWTFDASAVGGTLNQPSAITDGETGGVNFAIDYAEGVDVARFTAAERIGDKPGYSLIPVGGRNATCTTLDGAPVTVTNAATGTGFSLDVNKLDQITCTVYNQAPETSAALIVNKFWTINGGARIAETNQPSGLSAALAVNGAPTAWGAVTSGLATTQNPIVAETRDTTLPRCEFTGATLGRQGGPTAPFDGSEPVPLVVGSNVYEIVNNYECTSRLTLHKGIRNGPGDPAGWTLHAVLGPEDPENPLPPNPIPGFSGSTGVSGEVTPGVEYLLSESGGDPRYIPNGYQSQDVTPGAIGSWDCEFVHADGSTTPTTDGSDGDVSIGIGLDLDCSLDNLTAALTLSKIVNNDNFGTVGPDAFTLRAVPVGPLPLPPGVVPIEVTGSEAGALSWVRPEIEYELQETDVAGYESTAIECTDNTGQFVPLVRFVPARLANIQCRFTNDDLPANIIITKEAVGFPDATPRPYTFSGNWSGGGSFTIQAPGDGTLTDEVFENVAPGNYSVEEVTAPDSVLTALSCNIQGEDVLFDTTDRTATFPLVAGDTVQCFFTNAAVGTIQIIKLTDPFNFGGVDFPFTFDDGEADPIAFVLRGAPSQDTSRSFSELLPGTYVIDENLPPGWSLDDGDIDCGAGENEIWTPNVAEGSVTIELPPAGAVTCFYTDRALPPAGTIVKNVAGPDRSFNFTLQPLPSGNPTLVSVTTSGGSGSQPLPVALGQRYSLTETVPGGWTLTDFTCELTAADGTVTTVNRLDFMVGPGGSLVCTANDAANPATGTITKTALGRDGTFTFLLDTVPPTQAFEPITIATTGQVGAAALPPLTAGQTYSLVEQPVEGWVSSPLRCTQRPPSGTAAAIDPAGFVAIPGGVIACAVDNTALPLVAKTVASAVPESGDTWVVTYSLTVTNPTVQNLTYDLVDVLDLPAGMEVLSASATNDAGVDTSAWDGTAGTELATGVPIVGAPTSSETVHTYTITVRVRIDGSNFPLDERTCRPDGGGLFNGASMTHNGVEYPVAACADIAVSQLTLRKIVENGDTGKTGTPADWELVATPQGIPAQGTVRGNGDDGVEQVAVLPGSYVLSEESEQTGYLPGAWSCVGGQLEGDTLVLEDGAAASCEIVNTAVALAVDKTHDELPDGAVESGSGEPVTYRVTVSNTGAAVPDVVVTDDLPTGLALDPASIVAPDGWDVSGSTPTRFTATYTLGALPPGEYEFSYVASVGEIAQPDSSVPIDPLVNTACVGTPDPLACDDDEVPVASVAQTLSAFCRADAAYAAWTVTPSEVGESPTVVLIWWPAAAYENRDPSIPASDPDAILADGAVRVDQVAVPAGWTSGTPITGESLWPGTTLDASGTGIGWPGWRKQADGTWVKDASAPFFSVADGAVVEVRVNPSVSATLPYPAMETVECATRPRTQVPPPRPQVPVTGADIAGWLALATLLVAAGIGVRLVGGRRRHTA
ncbi:DUF11 domain-containing protein [Agromyces intestinalis]|uniref:DUF11 domain-containing protein n=1 Tax=Agromyces intestinalis TaxID=2592652 RepID=A0A5C1YG23_9MICO|nr:DUF11 domain-containing protein [Agromyces intestinalis]QEO15146.1 DUF11 domain-containing protein [Agromyces intestinalis]